MRTRTSESKMSDVNEDNSKNVRMSLHVLQPAATDKENLVGPGRSAPLCTERGKSIIEHEKKFLDNSSKSIKKKKHAKFNIGESSKKTVTANDLTSDDSVEYPSRKTYSFEPVIELVNSLNGSARSRDTLSEAYCSIVTKILLKVGGSEEYETLGTLLLLSALCEPCCIEGRH